MNFSPLIVSYEPKNNEQQGLTTHTIFMLTKLLKFKITFFYFLSMKEFLILENFQ